MKIGILEYWNIAWNEAIKAIINMPLCLPPCRMDGRTGPYHACFFYCTTLLLQPRETIPEPEVKPCTVGCARTAYQLARSLSPFTCSTIVFDDRNQNIRINDATSNHKRCNEPPERTAALIGPGLYAGCRCRCSGGRIRQNGRGADRASEITDAAASIIILGRLFVVCCHAYLYS